ncbi:MAG: hypothetical protein JWP13_810 [Candidatus Saccharibacteria bacterium]|nr:hypothetical protein [Candidatus Saccharibacteria bacterium]
MLSWKYMAEGKKRTAVKARKASTQASKGARRRQRTGSAVPRRNETKAYGSRTITKTSGQGLSITIQVPPLRRPKGGAIDKKATATISLKQRLLRPIMLAPILAIVAVIGIVGIPGKDANKQPDIKAAATERTKPDFQPLVPSAEKASATRYDGKRNMVTYTTTFSGIRITVSQQGLPDSFKKDPAAMLKAADSIKANQRIETDRGALSIATNEGGDQMAVFADEHVLLFIHAATKLDDVSWKSFIELLDAKSWEDLI